MGVEALGLEGLGLKGPGPGVLEERSRGNVSGLWPGSGETWSGGLGLGGLGMQVWVWRSGSGGLDLEVWVWITIPKTGCVRRAAHDQEGTTSSQKNR